MKLLLQGLAITVIALLFLPGYSLAETALNANNQTGGLNPAPIDTVSPAGNNTVPAVSTDPQYSSPDMLPENTAEPVSPIPTATIHPVPTPLVLSFVYTNKSDCINGNGEEDNGGGEEDNGVTVVRVSPGGAGSNFTENSTPGSPPLVITGRSGVSYGGKGSTIAGARVPDCLMKSMLLELLGDPDFVDFYTNLSHDLNNPYYATLVGLTPGQRAYMERQYQEDKGFINYCYDTNPNPYWVWVKVEAIFQTLNVRPQEFNTTLFVYSRGAEIPVASTIDTLVPDRSYHYILYIPVKCDQVTVIDSMKLDFRQVP